VSSLEALARFLERQTPALDGPTATLPGTPAARRRASERAAEELQRAGI